MNKFAVPPKESCSSVLCYTTTTTTRGSTAALLEPQDFWLVFFSLLEHLTVRFLLEKSTQQRQKCSNKCFRKCLQTQCWPSGHHFGTHCMEQWTDRKHGYMYICTCKCKHLYKKRISDLKKTMFTFSTGINRFPQIFPIHNSLSLSPLSSLLLSFIYNFGVTWYKTRIAIGPFKTYIIYSIQMCAFRRGQIISNLIPVPKFWWCSVEVFIHISSFPRWDKFSHLVKCTWPRTTPEPQPEAPLVRPMPEPQQNQYINIYIVYATFKKIIALLN